MISLYRDIIKEAWWITWRHKFLWFFGIFTVLLGNGGELEVIWRNVDNVSNQQAIIYNLQNISRTGRLQNIWDNITNYFTNNTLESTVIILLVLAIFVFIVWLVIVSQVGLIDSSLKLQSNQKVNLESGFHAGRKYFLPVFLLNLLGRVIVYGLLIIVGIPLILVFLSKGTDLWNTIFIIFSFIILIPLTIVISLIIRYSSAYVVLNKERAGLALKNGWKLFTKNWLISFEMIIVMFAVNILLGLSLVILATVLAIPFILIGLVFYYLGIAAIVTVISAIGIIVFIIMAVLVGSFISAFQWVAWMSLFKRLIEKKGTSKIMRMFGRLPDYLGKT